MTHLTAHITTMRHGKKDDVGLLHDQGISQSALKAIDIPHLQGDIILFQSGEQRVQDTVRIVGNNINRSSFDNFEDELLRKHNLQIYKVPTLHFLRQQDKKSSFFSSWKDDTNDASVATFLSQDDFEDSDVAYSFQEMARNLAQVLLAQIDFATCTDETFRTNFINGTHEPVIMSFLYALFTDFVCNSSPQEFLEMIGGSVGYAEGFEIEVFQDGAVLDTVWCTFRDQKKIIDVSSLRSFVFGGN